MRPVRFQRELFDGRIGRLSWRPLSFPAVASSLAARARGARLSGAAARATGGGPGDWQIRQCPSFFVGDRTDNLLKA
jgi:hypothetical protein